jgi:hypothetical protein
MVEGTLFLQTSIGPFTIGGGGVQENCGPNGEPSPGPLPENDSLACRISIRKAIEARGGACVFPE